MNLVCYTAIVLELSLAPSLVGVSVSYILCLSLSCLTPLFCRSVSSSTFLRKSFGSYHNFSMLECHNIFLWGPCTLLVIWLGVVFSEESHYLSEVEGVTSIFWYPVSLLGNPVCSDSNCLIHELFHFSGNFSDVPFTLCFGWVSFHSVCMEGGVFFNLEAKTSVLRKFPTLFLHSFSPICFLFPLLEFLQVLNVYTK